MVDLTTQERETEDNRVAAPVLEVTDATGAVRRHPLPAGKVVLGRVADANIRLDDVMVSRRHAELSRQQDGAFVVRDLDSRNGTLVNGAPVSLRVLSPRDKITVGPFVMTVIAPPPRGATAWPAPGRSTLTTITDLPVVDTATGKISTMQDVEPPRVDALHLMRLNEFSRQLLDNPDAEARLAALGGLMVGPEFRGRWAVVARVSKDAHEDSVRLLGSAQRGAGETGAEPYISRSVLRAVRQKQEAVLASNSGGVADVEVSMISSVMPVAVLACPLWDHADAIDLLYVILPPEYGTGEWLAMSTLAVKQYQQADTAWTARRQAESHAALERELNSARKIQMKLVPREPRVAGLDVAIGFVPCRAVGGDYVDALPLGDGRMLFAVADVCGKGMAAALIASSVYTLVHSGVQAGLAFGPLFEHINRYLCDSLTEGCFVTMFAAAVEPATGEFEYVNAGHPPPLVLRPGEAARQLAAGENLPLGCDVEPLTVFAAKLEPGELLALYSDGLTELADESDQMLGIEGLAGALWALYPEAELSTDVIAAALTAQLEAIQGSRQPLDDRTFLLVRREPAHVASSDTVLQATAPADSSPVELSPVGSSPVDLSPVDSPLEV